MTDLKKPVRRRTIGLHRKRRIVVSLEPGDLLALRQERCRQIEYMSIASDLRLRCQGTRAGRTHRETQTEREIMKKILLTTTLAKLREHSPCEYGYRKLCKSLGAKWPADKPINLLRILKSSGVDDMTWCLRATKQNCGRVVRLMAADFAESVLKYFTKEHPTDNRPALAIKAARDFAIGKIDAAARAAAGAAAWDAAWDAARDAARDAAGAAAGAAAWDAERKKQAAIIRKYLR